MSQELVGVLALQGAFREHQMMLDKLGVASVQLRCAQDISSAITRLILPGGESTVQGKLLTELGMLDPLKDLIEDGMPTMGTCAGMILLSKQIDSVDGSFVSAVGEGVAQMEQTRSEAIEAQRSAQTVAKRTGAPRFGTLDVCVRRNAYGRQLGSFHTKSDFGHLKDVPMTFIRAPYITQLGDDVQALAWVDGNVVGCKQGNQLVMSFHPELDEDTRIHELFMQL